MSKARDLMAEFVARANGWPGRGDKFYVAAAVMLEELKRAGLVEIPDDLALIMARGYEGQDAQPNRHDYRAAQYVRNHLTR